MSLQSHPATPPGPRPGRPNLLIGDVEREWVCRALSDHFTAGRLTPAEFDDRVEQAVAARTDADLRGLLNDLPTPTPAAVASTSGGTTAAANATPVLDVLLALLGLAAGMCLILLFMIGGERYGGFGFFAFLGGATVAAVITHFIHRGARRT